MNINLVYLCILLFSVSLVLRQLVRLEGATISVLAAPDLKINLPTVIGELTKTRPYINEDRPSERSSNVQNIAIQDETAPIAKDVSHAPAAVGALSRPISKKYSRAVCFLLANEDKGGDRLLQLNTTLRLVVENYLDLYDLSSNTKVVIFHDDTIGLSALQSLSQAWSKGFVQLANITNHPDFQPPVWRKHDTQQDRYMTCAGRIWKSGYIYQMVFRTRGIFLHSALDNVDLVMRLDTDMYFEKSIPFDLFDRFERDNLVYAYHECTREKAIDCLDGMPETIGNYTKLHGLTPKHLTDVEWNAAYVGNFGIARMSFYRGSEYQALVNYTIAAPGMYRARWTDQNINAIALAILVDKWQVANWYRPLSFEKILVHRSDSLGRLVSLRGNFKLNGDGPMCREQFGCACRHGSSRSADPEEMQRIKFTKFGIALPSMSKRAYCTMVSSDESVKGALVLLSSLRRTQSLRDDDDFVLLEVESISDGAVMALENFGATIIRSPALIKIDRTTPFGNVTDQENSWKVFAKIHAFNLTQYDRVVYIDSNMMAVRDISGLLDSKATPALSAISESTEPEFITGLLVIDPSFEVFQDMTKHIEDDNYLCGYTPLSPDRSFLCHYFHPTHKASWLGGTWNPLPRSYVTMADTSNPEAGLIQFQSGGAWSNGSQTAPDLLLKHWNDEAQLCGSHCEIPDVNFNENEQAATVKKRRGRKRRNKSP